ncbi:DUF6119 family protein [Bacillus sp. 1P02SD]|uniref:DUF6119 family protein n=1 Tax=Bacillus sp. 1P02SD TaxID=3132264 RepID=UPI0039A33771
MEFSIYKQFVTRENFIADLIEKGMERVGESINYNSTRIIDGEEKNASMRVDFFFKLDSEDLVEIEWAKYWGGYFGDNSKNTKSVESAFGMIIIEIEGNVFAISLGRGHSYASNTADMDFGFDIAEIIHDESSIEIKSAKFFKQTKNKSLTQYNVNSFVTSEIGESHELLVSKISLKEKYSEFLLHEYEDKMKFGSAVKLNVNDYNPNDILDIVHELHFLLLNEEKSGSLPRMNFLKNNEDNVPMIADLNRSLLNGILEEDSSVTLSYYIEDDGDIFIEPANDDQIEIVYKKSYIIDSYTIESIAAILIETECDDISRVSIRPASRRNRQLPLMRVLDFITEYRGKNYCLYKGKWASFNESYMEFIEREILKVNEFVTYDENYNLLDTVVERGREIQAASPDIYDQVTYTEYPYNIYLENEYRYTLLDRKSLHRIFKSVEFADLYSQENDELIHVKIGNTPELRYCIQQSLHSADIFNIHRDVLEEYDIYKINTVSMLFVTKISSIFQQDGSIDFSKIRSIYFKIEIIEWLTKMRTLNYTPRIIVAKDLRGAENPVTHSI